MLIESVELKYRKLMKQRAKERVKFIAKGVIVLSAISIAAFSCRRGRHPCRGVLCNTLHSRSETEPSVGYLVR